MTIMGTNVRSCRQFSCLSGREEERWSGQQQQRRESKGCKSRERRTWNEWERGLYTNITREEEKNRKAEMKREIFTKIKRRDSQMMWLQVPVVWQKDKRESFQDVFFIILGPFVSLLLSHRESSLFAAFISLFENTMDFWMMISREESRAETHAFMKNHPAHNNTNIASHHPSMSTVPFMKRSRETFRQILNVSQQPKLLPGRFPVGIIVTHQMGSGKKRFRDSLSDCPAWCVIDTQLEAPYLYKRP